MKKFIKFISLVFLVEIMVVGSFAIDLEKNPEFYIPVSIFSFGFSVIIVDWVYSKIDKN